MIPDIKVEANVSHVVAALLGQQKQIAFAAAGALNDVAFGAVGAAWPRAVEAAFDRPTAYIKRSAIVDGRARKDNLSVVVRIRADGDVQGSATSPEKVLRAEIGGGDRRMKRLERALQAIGALPPGMVAVPGAGIKLDANGNIRAGDAREILEGLRRSGGRVTYLTQRGRKRKANAGVSVGYEYFVGRAGQKRALGVWRRNAFASERTSASPILIFVSNAHYDKRVDFLRAVSEHVNAEWSKAFAARLHDAVATAR